MKTRLLLSVFFLPASLLAENVLPSPTSEAPSRPVVDLAAPGAEKLAAPSHDTHVRLAQAAEGKGLDVTIDPSPAAFPGISFTPPDGAYDLSGTGFVEIRVTNTGTNVISPVVRVDSPGGNASGNAYLQPGQSGKARAFFASPGKGSHPVDPAKVNKIIIFLGKNETAPRSFRLETLTAGGHPGEQTPVNPDLVRVKPKEGVIFSTARPFNAAKQLLARGGAKAVVTETKSLSASFNGKKEANILLKPVQGFWDLGDFLQVTVRVKNTGSAPASLKAQLTSRGSTSDFGVAEKPIGPGQSADLVIPFIPNTPFKIISAPEQNVLEGKKSWGVEETPGARFYSHQTTGLLLTPTDTGADSIFEILSVTAGMPEGDPRPEWLGQRPPVEGEWVKTFEDNFDGQAINELVWNVYSANYWDQRVGFSKKNVILDGGLAKLRIEKRDGHHNDDPNGRATQFATGWLDSYGKWNQTYGYYEVRVKLPTAPSMFPAFWLMPDRGPKEWDKHRRSDTKDGGMEFDVFEGQSMWGPYRTTFGVHWDSYMKYHKSAGTSAHYNRPDKNGFLTIGMLWLPGHISVYSNGRMQGSWDSPRVGSVPSHLIFDMLPGGFEYDPLDPAKLPAELEIDYVRVWQRKDLVEKK